MTKYFATFSEQFIEKELLVMSVQQSSQKHTTKSEPKKQETDEETFGKFLDSCEVSVNVVI